MKTEMNKQFFRFMLAAIVAPALFTACSSDDPEPEIPLEEFDGIVLNFTEVEAHDDHYDEVEDPEELEIRFKREQGSFVIDGEEDHFDLSAGKTYRLEFNIIQGGENVNDDFEGTVHQVFLTGDDVPEGAFEYEYADEDANGMGIGFEGYFSALEHTDTGFDLDVAMVHFSQGSKAELGLEWNDNDYASKIAGGHGHHDFLATIDLHFVDEHHDDDDDH